MTTVYEQYKKEMIEKIDSCKTNFKYQPILFIGSGFSKRYLNGPNWVELLQEMVKICPNIKRDFPYYQQKKHNDLAAVASDFVKFFRTWAWKDKGKFPEKLFSLDVPEDAYLKYKVSNLFTELVDNKSSLNHLSEEYHEELINLKQICPQAIVTTNYDTFLEDRVFTEYAPVVGQKIITDILWDVGEIYKIHGCAREYSSLVLTKEDYARFDKRSKYLAAKLLTFFLEHPIVFIGYGAADENIKNILSDVNLALGYNGRLMPNMFFIRWEKDLDENESYPRECSISLSEGVDFRMNNISARDYNWVFKAFKNINLIDNFNPKILRALQSRQYKLIREDIPKSKIQVNYEYLTTYSNADGGTLVKLYGIADAATVAAMSVNFPYTLTALANRLGYKSWHGANKLIEKVKKDNNGFNIKASDNIYHVCILQLNNCHLYSEAALQLLEKVKNNLPYKLEENLV